MAMVKVFSTMADSRNLWLSCDHLVQNSDNESMAQVLTFPEPISSVAVRRPGRKKFSDEDYWAFCEAEGEIIIVPPAGGESDYRTTEVIGELRSWARKDGRGTAFGSSVQFFLPDGSGLSPDAAWVSNASLHRLTRQQRKKFLRLSPEFVVEVLSPTDSLKEAKAKTSAQPARGVVRDQRMELWIANGVELAWLIDGDAQTVYVYRKGQPVKARRNIPQLAGDSPVAGFVLNLGPIWEGL
jgi:Uma2 family endonuclease